MTVVDASPRITASDEELRNALEAAHSPSLMNALVHMSGDIEHIRGNPAGHVTQNWPFTLLEFWAQSQAPDPDDYDFIEVRVPQPVT